MGYTTRFTGSFKVSPPLTVPHFNELKSLADDGVSEAGAPGSYLQWVPTDDGMGLCWDLGEKFYDYAEWLQWLIDTRLGPWGHEVSGSVRWVGEDTSDIGALVVEGNKVSKQTADARTVSVFVPLSLIQRHDQDGDAADDIAAHVLKSAKLQGAL